MSRIVGVGNITIDTIFEVSNIPETNEASYILDEHREPGGSTANVIASLQKFGYDTGLVARVGEDAIKENILLQLESKGINCPHVQVAEGEETSYTYIYTDESGNQIVFAGGSNLTDFHIRDSDEKYISNAEYLHTSAYASPHILNDLIGLKSRDTHLSFDLSTTFDELASRGYTRHLIDQSLDDIELFIAQESSLKSYLETKNVNRAISQLLSGGVKRVAITLGPEGAILAMEDERIHVPSFDVDIVDTTGAGDIFTAGLLHSWVIEDQDSFDAGRFANAAAALNAREFGGQRDLPSEEEVKTLRNTQN